MLPSYIQTDFLSNSELEYISNRVYSANNVYNDIVDNSRFADYFVWNYYHKEFADIKEIFDKRINSLVGDGQIIDHSHIIHSRQPYKIHTDYFQRRAFKQLTPAYTFIIPLETINSHTIVFDQSAKIKGFEDYLAAQNPDPVERGVDNETYNQYLTHCRQDLMQYLTVKEVFRWQRGAIHACDRRHFHCSDNYHGNGLESKKAIIMWTSVDTKRNKQ